MFCFIDFTLKIPSGARIFIETIKFPDFQKEKDEVKEVFQWLWIYKLLSFAFVIIFSETRVVKLKNHEKSLL